MIYCYRCNIEITKENESNEHIIINAIGGRLKSKKLLCQKCNSNFGKESDSCLASQLNDFMVLLKIPRNRGKSQPMIGKDINGVEYNANINKIKLKNTVTKIENNAFSIESSSEKEMKKAVKGLCRKYNKSDSDNLYNDVNWKNEEFNKPLFFNMEIGGDKLKKAICKCAINFYIHKGGDKKFVKKILSHMERGQNLDFVMPYYKDNIYNIKDCECFHTLYIRGDKVEKILYAYIDYFNVVKYIVILNDKYGGKNISYQYQYDLLNNAEIYKKIELNCTSYYISNLKNIKNNLSRGFDRCFNRILILAKKI
jgi:hypothetical protein